MRPPRTVPRRAAAAEARAQLEPPEPAAPGDGVFTLSSAAQVFARCARLLEAAERVALLDTLPAALERLRPELERAAARGVVVAVQAYVPLALAGVDVVVAPFAACALARWRGQ